MCATAGLTFACRSGAMVTQVPCVAALFEQSATIIAAHRRAVFDAFRRLESIGIPSTIRTDLICWRYERVARVESNRVAGVPVCIATTGPTAGCCFLAFLHRRHGRKSPPGAT